MTQEIIEMAVRAGAKFSSNPDEYDVLKVTGRSLEAFAKLATEAERERLFGMLHEMHAKEKGRHNYYLHAVVTLREKGEA